MLENPKRTKATLPSPLLFCIFVCSKPKVKKMGFLEVFYEILLWVKFLVFFYVEGVIFMLGICGNELR